MKLRKTVVMMLCFILFIVLTACNSSGSNNANQAGNTNQSTDGDNSSNNSSSGEGQNNAADQESVELRVSWWGGDSRHAKWNEMLDKFEEEYPHITVKREFTDYNAYWDKLATQAAGGNAPDVIMQVMHKFAEYADRGQLMELDELIDSGKIDLSDWSQPIIESGKLNGKTYMVSYGNTSSAILYNATLFENAGVEPPAMHWTWDDFISKANEIQSKLPEGTWATEDLGGYDTFYVNYLLSKEKVGFYTEEGQLAFDKQDMIDYLSMWDDMRSAGVTPPPSVQAEFPSERPEQTMLAQGKVSMFVRPLNQLPAFQNGTEDHLKLAMVPSDARSGHDLGGAYVSLYSKTKHPEEALLLLNFFISDTDAADVMTMEYGPMGSSAMNDYISQSLTPAEQEGISFMQEISDFINVPTHPPAGANEITQQVNLANEAVAFGQKSIEQAVNDFFSEVEKILK
jgi:multiple sugar transport system substrate-binding protein